MTNPSQKYWMFLIAFLLVVILCGGIVLTVKQSSRQSAEIVLSPPATPWQQGQVYIGGAVANPGFYPLRKADTLETLFLDAGVKPDADLNHIKIYVPKVGETRSPQKVSINRAEVWLLQTLPGIGVVRAQAIVNYRNRHGSFRRVEDLLNVEGIGSTTLEKIRDLITVDD